MTIYKPRACGRQIYLHMSHSYKIDRVAFSSYTKKYNTSFYFSAVSVLITQCQPRVYFYYRGNTKPKPKVNTNPNLRVNPYPALGLTPTLTLSLTQGLE